MEDNMNNDTAGGRGSQDEAVDDVVNYVVDLI